MKLYIDIKKAVQQMPSVGVDTPKEDQTQAEYDASYAKRPEGVAAGEAYDPDHPEVGGTYKHSEEDSNVSEDKKKQRERTKKAKDDGLVKSFLVDETPEVSTRKSALDAINLINKSLKAEKVHRTPNPREQEFLKDVLGYTQEDISKGVAVITGRNRSLFNKWLCDKLNQSTSFLAKSVGVDIG